MRRPQAIPGILLLLIVSACTRAYVGDPWTTNAAAWKRAHFASQTPDTALQLRAEHTQSDR